MSNIAWHSNDKLASTKLLHTDTALFLFFEQIRIVNTLVDAEHRLYFVRSSKFLLLNLLHLLISIYLCYLSSFSCVSKLELSISLSHMHKQLEESASDHESTNDRPIADITVHYNDNYRVNSETILIKESNWILWGFIESEFDDQKAYHSDGIHVYPGLEKRLGPIKWHI